MNDSNLLLLNALVSQQHSPPIALFLQNHPGAYTTTRTHDQASSLLFWDRHLLRLANSANILSQSSPNLLGSTSPTNAPFSNSIIREIAENSLRTGLPLASERRDPSAHQELAITALLSGNSAVSCGFDLYLHFGCYVPPVFGSGGNGARLAVVGPGREVAAAKYSDWVRRRKGLEKLRPPLATEILLSNDGDRILEGSVTNFFVVCRRAATFTKNAVLREGYTPGKTRIHLLWGVLALSCLAVVKDMTTREDVHDLEARYPFEVQTTPISDGVLPGVIRQLIIEICSSKGIPFREVAPSWSNHKLWEEAFVTNSLRLVQHVELIQAPISWKGLQSKTWKEVQWEEKHFEGLGFVTAEIQREIMERVNMERCPVNTFL